MPRWPEKNAAAAVDSHEADEFQHCPTLDTPFETEPILSTTAEFALMMQLLGRHTVAYEKNAMVRSFPLELHMRLPVFMDHGDLKSVADFFP